MTTKLNKLLFASLFALAVPVGIALAGNPVAISAQAAGTVIGEKCTNQEPGLVRERANYRAEVMEQRRAEEQARLEARKGAGLDRERAEMRARKLEERRLQQRTESAQAAGVEQRV